MGKLRKFIILQILYIIVAVGFIGTVIKNMQIYIIKYIPQLLQHMNHTRLMRLYNTYYFRSLNIYIAPS
jgi:uncharacterized membrane protein